jgi:hypothetical protein
MSDNTGSAKKQKGIASFLGGGAASSAMQRTLLVCKGVQSALLIPALEEAANREVEVGGTYFYPSRTASKRQKTAVYTLKVIGYDHDHTFGSGSTKTQGPAFLYEDVTEYTERGEKPWEDDYIPLEAYREWRMKTWQKYPNLYTSYKAEEQAWKDEELRLLQDASSASDPATIEEEAAEAATNADSDVETSTVCTVASQVARKKKGKIRRAKVYLY